MCQEQRILDLLVENFTSGKRSCGMTIGNLEPDGNRWKERHR